MVVEMYNAIKISLISKIGYLKVAAPGAKSRLILSKLCQLQTNLLEEEVILGGGVAYISMVVERY